MAYDRTKFQRQGGAGPQQHYSYVTADTTAATLASGYFNEAVSQIYQNDMIDIVSDTGTARVFKQAVVTSANGAVPVTVTAAT